MRKNTGKKIKSLAQGHRHSWSEQGQETRSPVKADICRPPSKHTFLRKSGFFLLLPSSCYHSFWESSFWSDTFNRAGMSSEICQFSRGRDLFGLRESERGSVWFCKHNLHTKLFLFPCLPIKRSRLKNHSAKGRFQIPRLNWRLQVEGPLVFTWGLILPPLVGFATGWQMRQTPWMWCFFSCYTAAGILDTLSNFFSHF